MSTFAQLESQGFNFPLYGDVYATENADIVSGIINQQVVLTGIAIANSIEIINDETAGTGYDLLVRLNAVGNQEIRVNAGEAKSITGIPISAIYLTNQSGAVITYRITVIGINNL